jgi:hypothetical protein
MLDVPAPKPEWVASWTDRGLQMKDPIALFEALAAQQAASANQERRDDTRTRWHTGHFYSPVASRAAMAADWPRLTRPHLPAEVDLRELDHAQLFRRLAAYFGTIPFSETKSPGHRYHYGNGSYGYGDALIYWSMLNHLRPGRIVEVGSGHSSALALDTIDRLGLPTIATFIDPYPAVAEAQTAPLRPPHRILASRVQDVDLSLFEGLQANDLLFIDSSHTVKTGSDVHFEITEILPRLAPGVVVHFHDVFFPFEYTKRWTVEQNYGWNETYFLHAFLMFNHAYRIEFFNHAVATRQAAMVRTVAPAQAERFLRNPGGGLWLRRV